MTSQLAAGIRTAVENARFGIRAVGANRLRSGLTVLGIVIGVATVIVMVAMVQGFEKAVVANMTSFGSTLIQYQKYEPRFGAGRQPPEYERNRRDLTVADALALKRLCPSLAAVSPERYFFSLSRTIEIKAKGNEANGAVVVGVYPDYMLANNHFVADGRFITDADIAHATHVVVIGDDIVKAVYPGLDPIGQSLHIDGNRYSVIGVFEHKGSGLGGSADNYAMIPLSTFDQRFPEVKNGGEDTIHIATVPKKAEWVDRALDEGTAVLRSRRGLRPAEPNDFFIFTPDGLLARTQAIRDAVGMVMVFIASVSLLVGGVGVMNVMLVAVTERTREIGTRLAIGAHRRDIVLQFLIEASLLTGLGGLLGIAIALAIVGVIRVTGVLPAVAAPWAIASGLIVSVAIGIFFGLYPAAKASRLDPIEALRHE